MMELVDICPRAEDMEIESGVHCPVEGCGQQLTSSSHLQMHLVRRHHYRCLEGAGQGKKAFYCPVEGCERAVGRGKPFPRMGQLKQHYQTVHGAKDFACGRCGKRFGLRDVCSRHEAECGKSFVCDTCREEFRTKNALYQHAKRKQHSLPEGRQTHRSRKAANSDQLPPIIITIRQVIEVPRDTAQETAVQTSLALEDPSHFSGDPPRSVLPCSPAVPVNNSSDAVPTTSQAVQADTSPYLASTAAQTDPDLTDLATQTDFSDFAEQFLSLGTQTALAGTLTQGCQTQPDASSCEFVGTQTALAGTLTQGCQTQPDANSCEFGTQTPSAADGTHDLATALSMVSVDFGTQTAAPPAIASSGTSVAAVDCDFMMEHLLPPECMDFGTQTLESSLVDVLPCLDLGMQTLQETRDQGSQTL